MDKNNKMLSFCELTEGYFNKYDIYTPLIQRNYKWNQETARKLAENLKDACSKEQGTYTVGMLTLYKEEDKERFQLIDGQQRMITFYMILRCLNPDKDYFTFRFERDEGLEGNTRLEYLKNIQTNSEPTYTDLERFQDNYNAIYEVLEELDDVGKQNLISYIQNNVYFLLHISETEPFDEFINLNKNKTRFVISDRIKANLVMDSSEDNRPEVLELFQSLSGMLFKFENNKVWKLLSNHYKEEKLPAQEDRKPCVLYPDENRLKLLCCERYKEDAYGVTYEFEKEFQLLKKYESMSQQLVEDVKTSDWNSYHAISCLGELDNKYRFFEMLCKLEEKELKHLEDYLLKKFEKLDKNFDKDCFVESQLHYNEEIIDWKKIVGREDWKEPRDDFDKPIPEWLGTGEEHDKAFIEIYTDYIDEKYNRENE